MAGWNGRGVWRRYPAARATGARRAMTLVELLIVVAIGVLLLGMAVPLMKPALKQGRTREASRQVYVRFAQAQARAREIGRPVAVWIERFGPGSNLATELYLAETPPAYCGDTAGSKAVVYYDRVKDNRWEIHFFDGLSASLTATTGMALVNPGERFSIRFGYRGKTYAAFRDTNATGDFVILLTDGQPPSGCWRPGSDGEWGAPGTDDDANGIVNDVREAGWDYAQNFTSNFDVLVGLPFQVFLDPRRSHAPPLQLPAGTVIDLEYSGLGIDLPFTQPATASRIAGLEFAGLWDKQSQVFVPDIRPVLIVISPDGSVDRVEYGNVAYAPTNAIHLLIGRNDQAVPADNGPATPNPIPWSAVDAQNFTYAKNIADTDCIWVSIGHRTGTLTTSENAWMLAGTTPNFVDSLLMARGFAQAARAMGGR